MLTKFRQITHPNNRPDIKCRLYQPGLSADFDPWQTLLIFCAELKKHSIMPLDAEKRQFLDLDRFADLRMDTIQGPIAKHGKRLTLKGNMNTGGK